MTDDFGHWLAGFADGEGCFDIKQILGQGRSKPGYVAYMCRFTIALRCDDAAILSEIRDQTGIGSISRPIVRGSGEPSLAWWVGRKSECAELVRIFDRYPLRAKKARDLAIWREAVSALATRQRGDRWSSPPDWSELVRLKAALEDARAFRGEDAPIPEFPEDPWRQLPLAI